MHGGIDQCFHHQEDVAWTGAADSGRHIYGLLIVDVDFLAQRAFRMRALAAFAADLGGRRPHGYALTDLRRRVGHRTHDGRMPCATHDRADARAGHDRQDHRVAAEMPAQIGHHVRHDLRLDAEDHDLAEIRRLAVVRREMNSVALYQLLAALLRAGPSR